VWGQHTAVSETYDLNFTGNTTGWTIGGTPANDNEYIDSTTCNEIITFDPHYLGVMSAVIRIDKYQSGSGVTPVREYRTHATKVGVLLESWHTYGASIDSLGWVQIRFIQEEAADLRITDESEQRLTDEGDERIIE